MSQPKDAATWKYDVGRVSKDMFTEHLFASTGEDCLSLMCGPHGMIEHCCVPFLEAMGYSKDRQIQF